MNRERSSTSSLRETSEISSSRVAIHSAENISAHTLPIRILPLSNSITSPLRSIDTQTTAVTAASSTSKSVPSFAETQLLSVYYLDPNKPDLPASDRCIFVEQQDRQPIRVRASYDPLSSAKSTQTSLTLTPLSTQGSTFLVDSHRQTPSTHNQHYKIHSGTQRVSPDEPTPDSDYSYEEYTVDVHTKRSSTSSTSSSSVTTVIAQNDEQTANHRQQQQQQQQQQSNGRVSSWPPVPDEILVADQSANNSLSKEGSGQSRPSRVQFAEKLIHIIPSSATNSLTNESLPLPSLPPGRDVENSTNGYSDLVREQMPPLDHLPVNQSKWIKDRMDHSEIRTTTGRVGALRSVFEQSGNRSSDSSTVSSPISQYPRQDPDEKTSRHGDEFRFRIEPSNGSSVHYAEPVKIVQPSSKDATGVAPLTWEALLGLEQEQPVEQTLHLDQIRQIVNRPLTSLSEAGQYLKDGRTWQWHETFCLSLTLTQRDQLKALGAKSHSRRSSIEHSLNTVDSDVSSSSNHTPRSASPSKRFTTTLNINPTRPQPVEKQKTPLKPPTSSIVTSSQESIVSSIVQQQILTSSKRTDSQTTMIESGYNSGDEQQRLNQFRPQSHTIIEESPVLSQKPKPSPPAADPLSYGYFIDEYFTLYARNLRSNDGTLLIVIDEQEIPMPRIQMPAREHFTLPKHIYSDAIDTSVDSFETESHTLVVFVAGEPIEIPADRWSINRRAYEKAPWIQRLKRVNREIPSELISGIEEWLAHHTRFSLENHQVHVDGLAIPLLGSFGTHLSEISRMQPIDANLWHDLLHYLIRLGYVSFNAKEKVIHIGQSELNVRLLLTSPSPELTDYLAKSLQAIDEQIHLDPTHGTLIISESFTLSKEYTDHLLNQGDVLNHYDLARLLLQLCDVHEDPDRQTLILSHQGQTLRFASSSPEQELVEEPVFSSVDNTTTTLESIPGNHLDALMDWLSRLNERKSIVITENNDILIHTNSQQQQIFLHHDDIREYRRRKAARREETDLITMTDIAEMLLLFNYVQYSSDHLTVGNEGIPLETSEIRWLKSIVRQVRSVEHQRYTEIELFDGEHDQLLQVPYEQLPPGQDRHAIARYLFEHGTVRHDSQKDSYHYRYNVSSEEKIKLIHQYVEWINDHNGITYDSEIDRLILENPLDHSHLILTHEHSQLIRQNQYRRRDVKDLLVQHGQIKQDEFQNWSLLYDDQCVQISPPQTDQSHVSSSSSSSSRPPQDISNELVEEFHSVINQMYHRGFITYNAHSKYIRIHFTNQILTIPIDRLDAIVDRRVGQSSDGSVLPFHHSRDLSQWLFDQSTRMSRSSRGSIDFIVDDQVYSLPSNELDEPEDDIHPNEDPNLKLLFPFTRSLRLIQKTASTSTLDTPLSTSDRRSSVDPLLMLANHIYRAGSIYQDEFGRLVIKLHKHEIVVPQNEAISSIEEINTSPSRTGTIIARLINRIGKVQSNQANGLIITVGPSSFEISRELIDRANQAMKTSTQTSDQRRRRVNPVNLPVLQQSRSASNLLLSSSGSNLSRNDEDLLYTKDGRGDKRYLNSDYRTYIDENSHPKKSISIDDLTRLESHLLNQKRPLPRDDQRARSTFLKPQILIIPDDSPTLSFNRPARFYVQYVHEENSARNTDTASVMMLPSQYPVKPTQPQLIAPDHYRDSGLRDASVYVRQSGVEREIYYENLAQYLATDQTILSSWTIRRLLKFTSREEYFLYLGGQMPVEMAEQLVQASESSSANVDARNGSEDGPDVERVRRSNRGMPLDRTPSTSSRLTQNTRSPGSPNSATPDKLVPSPRSTTLSAHSHDGESESRTSISRSASAAAAAASSAKVATSKSDTLKSNTSSSAASSREPTSVISPGTSITRTQSLVSPNRTNENKNATEVKKEKKSKFRTPSFLRKRKEKKEAAAVSKDKGDK